MRWGLLITPFSHFTEAIFLMGHGTTFFGKSTSLSCGQRALCFLHFLIRYTLVCWLGGVDWFHAGGGYVHHVYAVCVCVLGLACGIMYVYVYH